MSISMRPYAEVEWLILIMTQHDGFRLSSNVYQISIFGGHLDNGDKDCDLWL